MLSQNKADQGGCRGGGGSGSALWGEDLGRQCGSDLIRWPWRSRALENNSYRWFRKTPGRSQARGGEGGGAPAG